MSVKATLRDLGSLKVAFTDLGCGGRPNTRSGYVNLWITPAQAPVPSAAPDRLALGSPPGKGGGCAGLSKACEGFVDEFVDAGSCGKGVGGDQGEAGSAFQDVFDVEGAFVLDRPDDLCGRDRCAWVQRV